MVVSKMAVLVDIFEGILIGIVGGLVILYGLQPKQAYPRWMLAPYDHPWMFLVMLCVIVYIGVYFSKVLAGLLFLLVVSLYVDLMMFGRPTIFKSDTEQASTNDDPPVDGYTADSVWEQEGIPLSEVKIEEPNYPMFYGLQDAQPGDPAPF